MMPLQWVNDPLNQGYNGSLVRQEEAGLSCRSSLLGGDILGNAEADGEEAGSD
jgi:hypothetical protein